MLTDRTSGKKPKLTHMDFHLNTRKQFFECEGGCTLGLVAQRSCGVSMWGDTQNLTEHGCANVL